MLKGRNRNIQIQISDVAIARTISSLEQPFTIFSPGLAGIAKSEQFVSDGVLLRTIARGDANLVLRNTLLRLWDERTINEKWNKFIFDLKEIFPELNLVVNFASQTDENIAVTVNTQGNNIPLELSGTGVLQTVRILSYIHYFIPRIIVLDEPDSHLHPNNQRLICSLLTMIAQERGVQVLLSTHSRHVLDSLHGVANLLWARNGTIETVATGTELTVLLDLGALDIKEQIRTGASVCIVLTEDERTNYLKTLLESSGFDMTRTDVKSYYGCTSTHNLRPLIQTIKEINPKATIVVHKDRDYYTDTEINLWETEIRSMGAEPFVTKGVDIESQFLNALYISTQNPVLSIELSNLLINRAMTDLKQESISDYVNGRVDIEKKARTFGQLNLGNLVAQAVAIYDSDPLKYCHSKKVVTKMRQIFQVEHGLNLELRRPDASISSEILKTIARRTFPQATT